MAYKKASGVIEVVARNEKSIKIGDEWYGAFKKTQLKGAEKGDDVSFEYDESVKGDTTFLNIKGDVTIKSKGEAPAEEKAEQTSGGGGGGRTAARSSGGEDNRQRSIVRQNSLTNANNMLSYYYRGSEITGEPEDLAKQVLEIAQMFEKYSMVEDAA